MSCREDGDWQPLEANPWVVSVQGVRLEAYQRVCDYPLEVDSRNLARMGSNLVRRGEQPVYQVRSPQGHRSSRRRNAPTKSRRFADLPGWPLTVPKRPYGKRRESTSCHRGGRALCGNIGSYYLQWARPIPLKLVLAMVAGQSRSNSANDLKPACKHSASMALRRASPAKSCLRLNPLPRP